MLLTESVKEELKRRQSFPTSDIKGSLDDGTVPEAEQMDRMMTSGFMRTIAKWYANNTRAKYPDGTLPVKTIPENLEEDLTDEFSYMLVTGDELELFSSYLIAPIVEDILNRPDFICIGCIRNDGYTCGATVVRVDQSGMAELVWAYNSPKCRGIGKGKDMTQYVTLVLKNAGVKSIYSIYADYKNTNTKQEIEDRFSGDDIFFDTITEHFVSIPYTMVYERMGSDLPHKESCLLLDEIPEYFITDHIDTCDEDVKKRLNHYIDEAGSIVDAFDESSCVIYENGQLQSMLLTVPREDANGTVMLLLHARDASLMAATVSFSIERAQRKYGEDGYLTIALFNGMGKSLGEFFHIEDSWVKIYVIGKNL